MSEHWASSRPLWLDRQGAGRSLPRSLVLRMQSARSLFVLLSVYCPRRVRTWLDMQTEASCRLQQAPIAQGVGLIGGHEVGIPP